jgi:hypothetical protein
MLNLLQTLDLSSSGVTDTQFISIMESCPSLVSLNLSNTQIKSKGISGIQHHCQFIESLQLAKCGINGGRPQIDTPVLRDCLLYYGHNLRTLDLTSQNVDVTILGVLSQMKNLTSLTMDFVQNEEHLTYIEEIFLCCSYLNNIFIGNWDLSLNVANCIPTLTSFDCKVKISEIGCIQLAHRCPNLESLNLVGYSLTDQSFIEIAKLKRLKQFKATKLQNISVVGISALSQCQFLQRLELMTLLNDDCKNDQTMSQFVKNCRNLVSLKLGKTAMTNIGVKSISQFKLLKLFSLDSFVPSFEEEELDRLAFIEIGNNCVYLEDLRLRWINCIDDSIMCNFAEHCPLLSSIGCEFSCFSSSSPTTHLKESEKTISQDLKIKRKHHLSSNFITSVGKGCRNLKTFQLSDCALEIGNGLKDLHHCKKLGFLSISNCTGLEDQNLEELITKCCFLTRIELDPHCFSQLNAEDKERLRSMKLLFLITNNLLNNSNTDPWKFNYNS